ncbi:probable carboxylesterase 6 [Diospyros lotus]|uniref:probable carboxylesterase 6 n=1 Tax=Diospyros lotus TaxID=55363 RepID=UPI002255F65D|nr:probable carboxylesterase 6 [Diospyros lotus]
MAATTMDLTLSLQISPKNPREHGAIVEEIEGLIRVYEDGHVERPQIVPLVTASLPPELGVSARDTVVDRFTNIWARFYMPKSRGKPLPLLVYFHGGGFCVGSAAWSCYHEFLAELAAAAGCVIMSLNYRLAPENPLPAAFEDGFKAVMWLRQQALFGTEYWWSKQCNFSKIFLAGDSAGGNIAYNVAIRLASQPTAALSPFKIKGTILIQPFFGGEERTNSEKFAAAQPPHSALNLSASDTYWRLALPAGANRDHPWSNPVAKGSGKWAEPRLFPSMVCISEMDILKDRNLEFCAAFSGAGAEKSEHVIYRGVGHAFQILNKSLLSQSRTHEMISHIKAFISRS